jgi:phospholipid/cholesterol/gamma-HCH transport system substrate-binding protein
VAKVAPGVKDTKVYMYITGNIRVPEGSTLRVAFDGLIGQKYLEILPSASERTVKPRTELQGYNTLGLVDFIDVGTLNLEELQGILKSVRRITDDPETQKAVKDALLNIQAATYQLNKFVADLNEIMSTKEFKQSMTGLKEATDSFVKVSKKLDSITEAIDKLASDPKFGEDLKGAASEAKAAMEELKNAASDVRKTLRKLVRE